MTQVWAMLIANQGRIPATQEAIRMNGLDNLGGLWNSIQA